ncbi:hypothetical protein P3S67_014176 [Capsicum chacoense]
MEIGLAVGGAFLNVLFDGLAHRVELLKMFQKNKHDDGLLEKLGNILLGLQIVLSDAENKQASDQRVRQWLNKLQSAVDSAENLMEEVNYETLKLKVEECCGRCLSDDFFLNIKEKLEDTIKNLEELEKQIGRLGLQRYFDSGKKLETRPPSTSVVESDVFGRRNEIEELIDHLTSKERFTMMEIRKLPDSICALYNLEMLLLSSCYFLEELPPQMEKLINLHHLDISNTSRLLKNLQVLHLSKLKSLPVLVGAEFLVGGPCGWRMEDLGGAHYVYGSLSILELQNVVDRREPQKANMREKNHVEKLSLEWSGSDADNSQTEREILDELRPDTNIKELQISGYRGTQFPNWLDDHSFLKRLVQLSLRNCKDYAFDNRDNGGITEEFYGIVSSRKPFNSLEELKFAEMPEWKQWHVLGNGEFPALRDLSIEDCPKLMGKLPENLCSLTKLRISRCPELNLETPIQLSSLKKFQVDGSPKAGVVFDEAELFISQLEGMKQIEELDISNCNSLTSLPTSTLPSTLKTIRICHCRKLKLETSVGEMNSNMFLEELRLVECDSVSSPELVPRARNLWIESCQNLTRFLIPNGTERVDIWFCENLEVLLSVACGTQMTSLCISGCKKLKRLPEGMQELLPSLNKLRLYFCPEIESFPYGGLPFNLQILEIVSCEKLVNGRKEWRLQRLHALRVLHISHNGSDEEIVGGENWELPCSIRSLGIRNLKTLSSQVLKSLTSLECLYTEDLPQIQSLLEQGLPSSLSELRLRDHDELHSLPTEGLGHLTSLQIKGMPSSLSKLSIRKRPFLKPPLEFDKGEYWTEIAHISTIEIDDDYL